MGAAVDAARRPSGGLTESSIRCWLVGEAYEVLGGVRWLRERLVVVEAIVVGGDGGFGDGGAGEG